VGGLDQTARLVSRPGRQQSTAEQAHRRASPGQTHTARVITAAAAIMIAVFITFVFTGQVDIAEFGIGLAAAMPPDGRPPSTTVKLRTNVQSTTPRCS
jgi:putative drug exporter of the RND superfamily